MWKYIIYVYHGMNNIRSYLIASWAIHDGINYFIVCIIKEWVIIINLLCIHHTQNIYHPMFVDLSHSTKIMQYLLFMLTCTYNYCYDCTCTIYVFGVSACIHHHLV